MAVGPHTLKAASTQSLSLRPAPQTKAPKLLDKGLVLKRIYRQFPKLKLNQLVAKAVLEQPRLKLREAEEYFRVRRQHIIDGGVLPRDMSSLPIGKPFEMDGMQLMVTAVEPYPA